MVKPVSNVVKNLGFKLQIPRKSHLLMELRKSGRDTGVNAGFAGLQHAGKLECGLINPGLNILEPIDLGKRCAFGMGQRYWKSIWCRAFSQAELRCNVGQLSATEVELH